MKYLYKILIVIILFISGCADYKGSSKKEKKYYSSSGFVLIYKDKLFKDKIINKKINNEKLLTIHNSLKKNTPIKIINPVNDKSIETKVHYKGKFPQIFNIVITEKIAQMLELDINNPFVKIYEVKKNKTFIAKESSMFEEEKNVADKAPVDEIEMLVLTTQKAEKIQKKTKISEFVLVISDFYYLDSANSLKNELIKKININNISVKKINDKKYRLLVGPFKNFNALKTTYISLNNLGFENLNVYEN